MPTTDAGILRAATESPTQFLDFERMVNPRSVAVIGASPNHAKGPGRIAQHLVDGNFDGHLYLVNPKYEEIDGHKCYPSIADLPEPVDLAVIMIKAKAALEETRSAAKAGTKFTVIMSSGFAEGEGDKGVSEDELREIVRESGMRIYGPNCPGFLVMHHRRAISFSPRLALERWRSDGRTALITQGGAMGRAVIDSMEAYGSPGLSYWFSCGNEADLQISDFLGWLADDPETDTVIMIVESFRNGRKFLEAAVRCRETGTSVVVLKIGRSDAGMKATATHTAALVTADAVVDAAFDQCGVIRVDDVDELVDLARILERYGVQPVKNVGVVSLSGGSVAHVADLCGVHGLNVDPPTDATLEKLRYTLPALAAITNPIDLSTEIFATPELVGEALGLLLADANIDALVMPFPYQLGRINHVMAEKLAEASKASPKPIIAIGISEDMNSDPAASMLRQARVPFIPSSTKAVMALRRYARIADAARSAQARWTPAPQSTGVTPLAGKGSLSEDASEDLLRPYGITFAPGGVGRTADECLSIAEGVGFPVVLKGAGNEVLHKSDAGLVRLGITNEAELRRAYKEICANHEAAVGASRGNVKVVKMVTGGVEFICGVSVDPTFGPLVTFGLGGIYTELLGDVAMALCPLTTDEARRLISRTKAAKLLAGARGQAPLDNGAAAETVAALSQFAHAHAAELAGVDINPLKVLEVGALALDALVILTNREET